MIHTEEIIALTGAIKVLHSVVIATRVLRDALVIAVIAGGVNARGATDIVDAITMLSVINLFAFFSFYAFICIE